MEKETLVNKLKGFIGGEKAIVLAYLFGSRAKGEDVKERSDIDIAILWSGNLTKETQWEKENELYRKLLNIVPSGVDIDIVNLNYADEILRHEVIATGECVHAQDEAIRVECSVQWFQDYVDTEELRKRGWDALRQQVGLPQT